MAQGLTPTKADDNQNPPEISNKDWSNTPASVRKVVRSLSKISDEDTANTPVSVQKVIQLLLKEKLKWGTATKNYTPIWTTLFMLFANGIITLGLVFLLANRVAARCVSPPIVSVISLAIILLLSFHLIWRNMYYAFVPPNYQETIGEAIQIGILKFPITYLITFCNEIQPWKLSNRLLALLLLILIAIGAFLNLSPYSLFYVQNKPSLQGFSIERLDMPPEKLAIDRPLVIKTGEKVFIEAVLLGGVEASCTWSTATGNIVEQKDCSTVFSVSPGIKQDVLTVIVQPSCGTLQESVNLPIVVQNSQN